MRSTKEQDRPMDKLLTWDEAAERLNTTPRHVRRLVFERRIAYRKLGRYVRFHPDDLEEYITANRVEVRGAAGVPTSRGRAASEVVSDGLRGGLEGFQAWSGPEPLAGTLA
jgi:excisionase family DNA binding protein